MRDWIKLQKMTTIVLQAKDGPIQLDKLFELHRRARGKQIIIIEAIDARLKNRNCMRL